jgi:superfamily II RNA helicase
VASALHFDSLARKRRSVYTCPIKALVNEKWMALCRELGPENVGLATGDATVNRDAPVLCCTAEILANIALREGKDANVDDVVMDEFHWYADRDRGVAWQVPLLTLSHTRFLLMSATLGDVTFFAEALSALNDMPTATVKSGDRPVPLEYAYSEIPLAQMLEKLEYPRPRRDLSYGTFNAFADRHPWVGEEDIRPKSIAREMFEGVSLVLGVRAGG